MNKYWEFETEKEFKKYFEKNLKKFGVKKIVDESEPFPDYIVIMDDKGYEIDGRHYIPEDSVQRVEVELFAKNFIKHKHHHDPNGCDLIIAAYSEQKEIFGVPVLALNWIGFSDDLTQEEIDFLEGDMTETALQAFYHVNKTRTFSVAELANIRGWTGDWQLWLPIPKSISRCAV